MTDTDPTFEHPTLVLSLRTRTRLLGTVNVALALRGRSTGWGRGGKPRRTFFGHNRVNPGGGYHFLELVIRDAQMRERTLLSVGRRWRERRAELRRELASRTSTDSRSSDG